MSRLRAREGVALRVFSLTSARLRCAKSEKMRLSASGTKDQEVTCLPWEQVLRGLAQEKPVWQKA